MYFRVVSPSHLIDSSSISFEFNNSFCSVSKIASSVNYCSQEKQLDAADTKPI